MDCSRTSVMAGEVKLRKKSERVDLRGMHYALPLKLRSSQQELRSVEVDEFSISNRPLSGAELISSFASSNSSSISSFNHRYRKSGSSAEIEMNLNAGGFFAGGGLDAFSPENRSLSASNFNFNLSDERCAMNLKPKRLKYVKVEILQKGMICLTESAKRSFIECDLSVTDWVEEDPLEVAKVINYLRYIVNDCCSELVILINCAVGDVTGLNQVFKTLQLLQKTWSAQNLASIRVIFVDPDSNMTELINVECIGLNVTLYSMDQLHAEFGAACLGESFNGNVKQHREEWLKFRRNLEPILDKCNAAARQCLLLAEETKRLESLNDFRQLSMDVLEKHFEGFQLCMNVTKEDANFAYLEQHGRPVIDHLQNDYPDLKCCPNYGYAAERISAFFFEVLRVRENIVRGAEKRLLLLRCIYLQKKFITEAPNFIKWYYDEAQETYEKCCGIGGGNFSEEILHRVTQKLEDYHVEARSRVSKMRRLHDEAIAIRDAESLSADEKAELGRLFAIVGDVFERFQKLANLARGLLIEATVCHKLLEDAFQATMNFMQICERVQEFFDAPKIRGGESARQAQENLRSQLQRFPPPSAKLFQQIRRLAEKLNKPQLIAQANDLESKHVEREKLLRIYEEKIAEMVKTELEEESTAESKYCDISSAAAAAVQPADGRRRSFAGSTADGLVLNSSDLVDESGGIGKGLITLDLTDKIISSISLNTIRKKRNERRSANSDGGQPAAEASDASELELPKKRSSQGRLFKRLFPVMKRSSTWESGIGTGSGGGVSKSDSWGSIPSSLEESQPVLGLDESKTNSSENSNQDRDSPPPFKAPPLPVAMSSFGKISTDFGSECGSSEHNDSESFYAGSSSKLDMIISELLETEANYINSLHYVMENYLPEMQRSDLPHALRGHKHTIFGNLEKIFEFHCAQLLPDLQDCAASEAPGLQIGKCFMNNDAGFHLYALYNKNKPKSEALMSECGQVFFHAKQLMLNDRLGLSSHLLKPVQRIGKYALLLRQLIKVCPADDSEQLDQLKRAEKMISSQLRHGNDLLAMESIRGNDLNLMEQGKLLRTNEFSVRLRQSKSGRKSLRRVFLFEDLVLFAKPVRSKSKDGRPHEVFQYKHSIKVSDLGITVNVDDSPLHFELWFRRHTSPENFVCKAESAALKDAWCEEITTLLVEQAKKNRAQRSNEASSMGITNTTVDLPRSTDQIEDRSVSTQLLQRMSRFRRSLTQISDPLNAQRRPHSLISVGSCSMSSQSSGTSRNSGNSATFWSIGTPDSGIWDLNLPTLKESLEEHVSKESLFA